MRVRWVLLVALWGLAIALGWHARQRIVRQQEVERLCSAVRDGDWQRALEVGESAVAGDALGMRAADCRAKALMASGQSEPALELLDRLLVGPRPVAGYPQAPDPILIAALVEWRQRGGRLPEAIELVRSATAEYPNHVGLLSRELDLRAELEKEAALLEDFTRRLPAFEPPRSTFRLILARRALAMGLIDQAGSLMRERPPPASPELVTSWYQLRIALAGAGGDYREVRRRCQEWADGGGAEAEVLASHAMTLSLHQLNDPDYQTVPLLRAALNRRDEIASPGVVEVLYRRLIGSLFFLGENQLALEVWEEASSRLQLDPVGKLEIQRAAQGAAARGSRIRFIVRGGDAPPGSVLAVSPPVDAALDRQYDVLALGPDGVVSVDRSASYSPTRWVLLDEDGRGRGSGAVWPGSETEVEVEVTVRPPSEPALRSWQPGTGRPFAATPADGRKRVFGVLLDCADWRFVQYLRTRGDLPVIDAMITAGHSAVLESTPAFTAAAMASIAYPGRPLRRSIPGVLHELGTELSGNVFIAHNAFGFLEWVLPRSSSLFSTLGAGPLRVLNLLHSYGGAQGGAHGELIGPAGARESFVDWRIRRELEPDDLARDPDLLEALDLAAAKPWLEETAAAFDALLAAIDRRDVDLALLRVPIFDIATHSSFAKVTASRQDDGRYPLYALYRYADQRIGELARHLDGDDILLVFSDHGIRTSAQHDKRAVFVAAGGGIAPGRIEGMPHLRGLPRLLADLFGVATEWPATGIEVIAAELVR